MAWFKTYKRNENLGCAGFKLGDIFYADHYRSNGGGIYFRYLTLRGWINLGGFKLEWPFHMILCRFRDYGMARRCFYHRNYR